MPCLPEDLMATAQLVLPLVVQCLYETIDEKVKTGNGKGNIFCLTYFA